LYERTDFVAPVSLRAMLDGEATVSGRSNRNLEGYVGEIVAGGFRGLRHFSGRALAAQLGGYIDRIVDHDLPEAGFSGRHPATIRGWLRAYAAATATTASWEKIREAAASGLANKPAKTTTAPYTELLTTLHILDPIEAWLPTQNHFRRLASGPKHHLVDPALAARLLGRTERHLLRGHEGAIAVPRDGTLLGGLFESLVALSVRTYAQAAEAHTYHLRTDSGRHEVDFIIE
jgi:predicted AAA+ superfamily ATPase